MFKYVEEKNQEFYYYYYFYYKYFKLEFLVPFFLIPFFLFRKTFLPHPCALYFLLLSFVNYRSSPSAYSPSSSAPSAPSLLVELPLLRLLLSITNSSPSFFTTSSSQRPHPYHLSSPISTQIAAPSLDHHPHRQLLLLRYGCWSLSFFWWMIGWQLWMLPLLAGLAAAAG